MLSSWITSRGLGDTARSFLAKIKSSRGGLEGGGRAGSKSLEYTPFNGSFYFWYKWQLLLYSVQQENTSYYPRQQVSLSCFGRSSQVLRELLQECQDEYNQHTENQITIFGHSGSEWKKEKTKEARPLSTVILKQSEKVPLVEDIEEFLSLQTRTWYMQRSIPYRRGYLLHGPPGTGKSSFSLSIAGELNLDIYVVSIPSVDDQLLKSLFDELPSNCVVLLEDIDAIHSAHSRDLRARDSEAGGLPSGLTAPDRTAKGSVTLSGLLNVLDGVASQEDRVLIMTTNHIDKLDAALIRPGRIDRKVEFGLADQDTTAQIYRYMFDEHHGRPGDRGALQAHHVGATDHGNLAVQAVEFANRVPEGTFSPAQIMSYLLPYRTTPTAALDNVSRWVETMQRENEAPQKGQPC